jgi:hypothetical protein
MCVGKSLVLSPTEVSKSTKTFDVAPRYLIDNRKIPSFKSLIDDQPEMIAHSQNDALNTQSNNIAQVPAKNERLKPYPWR